MRFTVSESTDPPIKDLLEKHFILWYDDVDTGPEHFPYSVGLGGYILPLITVITMDSPDTFLDRSTGRQHPLRFIHRLKQHIGDLDHSVSLDLKDAILSLKILASEHLPAEVFLDGDVNGDKQLGVAEVINALNNTTYVGFDSDCDEQTSTCHGVPVVLSTTGQIWMDRNLGASRVATSPTDQEAFGDLYQWGRLADGHQHRNSSATTTLSTSDTPEHGQFIQVSQYPVDWRTPQNNGLWQIDTALNNPCPSGFRVPTADELELEWAFFNILDGTGAYNSPLKLPMAGKRTYEGVVEGEGTEGRYWTSTVSGVYAKNLYYISVIGGLSTKDRAVGCSIRCIKD